MGAHGVHVGLAEQIKVEIVGVAAGGNGGDERLGEGLAPYLMLREELPEIVLLFGTHHRL